VFIVVYESPAVDTCGDENNGGIQRKDGDPGESGLVVGIPGRQFAPLDLLPVDAQHLQYLDRFEIAHDVHQVVRVGLCPGERADPGGAADIVEVRWIEVSLRPAHSPDGNQGPVAAERR
jgi:hypothetical protein